MPEQPDLHNQHPSVLLVLHDVAPETWPDYQPFVEAVDALGDIPMTLCCRPRPFARCWSGD